MNVKLIFPSRIESWDTRADGSATTSHAQLLLSRDGRSLQLWSCLWRDEFDADGNPIEDAQDIEESGYPREIARLEFGAADDLYGFFSALHGERGLLRLDVDGETMYECAPDENLRS